MSLKVGGINKEGVKERRGGIREGGLLEHLGYV